MIDKNNINENIIENSKDKEDNIEIHTFSLPRILRLIFFIIIIRSLIFENNKKILSYVFFNYISIFKLNSIRVELFISIF